MLASTLHQQYGYAKQLLAKVLGFSRGLFYYESKLALKDRRLAFAIEQLHQDEDDTLGQRSLAGILNTGKNRVSRVMKKYGIQARRRSRKYNYPGKSNIVHDNLANDPIFQQLASVIIFSDIFEVRLADYSRVRGCFALRKDSRQVLSLVFDYGMDQGLVQTVIKQVDTQELLAIFHTDQGKQ